MKAPVTHIAVIGMAGRFPGADSVDEYLELLRSGREATRRYSPDELRGLGVDEATIQNPRYVPASATIDGADGFDAGFFRFSPTEAARLDPQHRLALECAWHTFEDALIDPRAVTGRVGIYCGAGLGTYWLGRELNRELSGPAPAAAFFANAPDFLATRIAYKLGTTGPAVNIQTACSTALVSVHLACQALLAGDADLALAGASDLYFFDAPGYFYEEGGNLSPDGHCRAFDAKANGTIPGRGVGFVLLKPLADAQRDGNRIYAIIKGTAINNDGADKVGYTAPSVDGQADVIYEAHHLAGFAPDSVGYIEAHGTGTSLGDPIELRALREVFRGAPPASCAIGSVKTGIGHPGAAAGIAGLIKTILSLRHGELFPSLHFTEANPELGLDESPFYVITAHRPWTHPGRTRRAGVSAFGIGGTNAHVAVEQAPELSAPVSGTNSRKLYTFLVSAGTRNALESTTANLVRFLRTSAEQPGDIAASLARGRRAFAHRRAVVASSNAEAADLLAAGAGADRADPPRGKLCVLFPGQGTGGAPVGRDLYAEEEGFRAAMDECARELALLDFDLRAALFGGGDRTTAEIQPVLFSLQYSFARLLQDRGVFAESFAGHSTGEFTAATLAGVFSLADALRVIRARGLLMARAEPGAMLAVPLSEERCAGLLGAELSLAAINAPERCVLSGSLAAVERVRAELSARGVQGVRLPVDRGFHSYLMDPVLSEFRAVLETTRLNPPRLPYVSGLTGTWITSAEATDPAYYLRQLRQPVRFLDAIRTLMADPERVFVEAPPGATLRGFVRQAAADPTRPRIFGLAERGAGPTTEEPRAFESILAGLWRAGFPLDPARAFPGEGAPRVALPLYPFERERYTMSAEDPGTVPVAKTDPVTRLRYESFQRWLYPPRTPAAAAGPILLFLDEQGIGAGVADALILGDPENVPTLARSGPAFARSAPREFRVSDQEGDLRQLLETLADEGNLPARILDFRALDGAEIGELIADAPAARRLYLERPIALARTLARISSNPVEIIFFANGVAPVTGAETPVPAAHFLLGPTAVIPREYTWMNCRLVDLEDGREARIRAALAEIQFAPDDFKESSFAAYRAGVRWVRADSPLEADPRRGPRLRQRYRAGGVYVIAGGSGGIGRLLAEHLAAAAADSVVVRLSRHPAGFLFPTPGSATVKHRIFDLSLDITDPGATARAFEEIRARFGPVRGLIHAAGSPAGGLIERLDPAKIAATIAPRVRGTVNLMAAVGADELDFIVFCSSLGVQVGYPGQADYAAANAFLDGFARKAFGMNQAHTAPILSVRWDRWRSTGMAAREAAVRTREVQLSERDWLLNEHRYRGRALLPGAAWLELVRETYAADRQFVPVIFDEILFLQPAFADESSNLRLSVILEREPAGGPETASRFYLLSRPATGEIREHATGRILALRASPVPASPPVPGPGAVRTDGSALLRAFARAGDLDLGDRWTGARIDLWTAPDEIIAKIEFPADYANEVLATPLHPALLDLGTGLARALAPTPEVLYLPLSYRRFALERPLPARLTARVRRLATPGPETLACSVEFFDPESQPVGRIEVFTLKRVAGDFLANRAAPGTDDRYTVLFARAAADEAGGLTPAAALEAFDELPVGLVPVVQIVAGDEAAVRRHNANVRANPALRHARPALSNPYEAPHTPLTQTLATLWEATLGIEAVGLHDNFFELGGDSLLALRLIPRARELGLAVEPGLLFRYPTVAALGDFLSAAVEGAPAKGEPEQVEKEEEEEEAIDPADLARARGMVRYRQ